MMALGEDADALREPLLDDGRGGEQRVLRASLAALRADEGDDKRDDGGEGESEGFEWVSERETLVFADDKLIRQGASNAGGFFAAYFMSKIQPGSGALAWDSGGRGGADGVGVIAQSRAPCSP